MKQKRHLSNRAQRRAAERAAFKAARKNSAVSTPAPDLPGNAPPPNHPNHSTGPRTEAGKQTSARNAIKHGLCAPNTLILATEKREDYLALEANWFQTYRVDLTQPPLDPLKSELIRTAARAEWLFKRAERNYFDVEATLSAETADMADWTDQQYARLSRVLRYRTANANLLAKHRKELEAHIKARAAEATFYQNMQHKDAKLTMARERLDIYREKNKPFDFDEEIEAMTQKAIRLGFHDPEPGDEQDLAPAAE